MFVSFLSLTDSGQNEVQLISGDENTLIVYNVNVDEDGRETEIVGLFGRYDILKSYWYANVICPLTGLSFRISRGADSIQGVRPASLCSSN